MTYRPLDKLCLCLELRDLGRGGNLRNYGLIILDLAVGEREVRSAGKEKYMHSGGR